ncbi:MAG TPA: hypothetical protein VF411_10720 [Bacteroidia bacterium]
MANGEKPIKKEQSGIPSVENIKRMENHREVAVHLVAAGMRHKQAANHYATGNHDKAAECIVRANYHHCAATDLFKHEC